MAQVPPYYCGNFHETPQAMSGTHPIHNNPFMTSYASIDQQSNGSIAPPYSPKNNYNMAVPSWHSPQNFDGQPNFNEQHRNAPLNVTSPPLDDGRNSLFRNSIPPSGHKSSNQLVSFKVTNNSYDKSNGSYDQSCLSEELDEHLNNLPLESLLHLTQHEGQLINESENEDRLGSDSSSMCIDVSTGEEVGHSLFRMSNPKNFYVDTDRDDDDSGSCISSSTMYSMTSTSDSVVPIQPLTPNYELSNHSSTAPNSVSSCIGSPYDASSFSDAIMPSHPFNDQNNPTTSMNSSSQFTNVVCSTSNNNNNFLAPVHPDTSPSDQPVDYHPVSPNYQQNTSHLSGEENFNGLYSSSQSTMSDLKNSTKPHKVPRKTKKDARSEQVGPKNAKKPKVKRISTGLSNQSPFNNQAKSSAEQNSRTLNDVDQRRNGITTEDTTDAGENSSASFSSDNMSDPSPKSNIDINKETMRPRKRMRCPRGMTLQIKPCDVCGDNAKNMHFGGLVCDSCKAFFRRSVQSATSDQFKCEKEENCVITKANRRSCQYCRFQKCEKIGMQQEWVMTESGRMSLLKNRLARTRHIHEEKQNDVIYGDLPRTLDKEDAKAINHILNKLHTTFSSMPYPKECIGDSIDTLSNIFVYLCKRFGKYFLDISDETDLCNEDKTLLLKNGISMSLYINGAHMYDPVSRSWPAECTHETVKVPYLTLDTLQKLASIPDAFSTIMKFYESYESDLKDHVVAVLMYLISFFIPEDPNFIDCASIQAVQDNFIGYLKRYLIARDGYQCLTGVFLKMMEGLSYVKDILKFHTLVDIKPTIDHTDLSLYDKTSISQSMTNLIHHVQISFNGNFPPYASVLNDEEKESLGILYNESSVALRKRRGSGQVMQNHPDTIAIFGSTTKTDMLITQPFENMIEWQEKNERVKVEWHERNESASPSSKSKNIGDVDVKSTRNGDPAKQTQTNNHKIDSNLIGMDKDEDMSVSEEVDIDAVCDILRQLSHTDDVKVLSILKENIPRELFEKFSRTLSEDES